MDRRQFLTTAGAAPLVSTAETQQAGISSERPPNILFLLFDKCRTDAIGAYRERDVHTPNLDRIAAEGVRFANCYTPQALCGPARASILTGSYPHIHGLKRNVYPHSPGPSNSTYQEPIADPFRDGRFRLWDNFVYYLNASGYATAHIGKWHLGPANPGIFDYWKSFNSLLLHWIGEPHQSRYRPDVHTDQGISFIERHADEPFFLYQSYYSPHEPLDPPKRFLELYGNQEHAGYYGSVTSLDWNVGRILDVLERLSLLDSTFILMATEHGRSWQPRPGTTEGMCTAYQESARIPLLMRYPAMLSQGKVWESGVSLVDLMPTLLRLAGIKATMGAYDNSNRPVIQGRDLIAEVHSGNDDWSRPIIIQNIPQRAIDGAFYEERALRAKRYKLILRKFDSRPVFRPGELYDLQGDPGERKNLYSYDNHHATVKTLAASMKQWGEANRDELSVELGSWAEGSG